MSAAAPFPVSATASDRGRAARYYRTVGVLVPMSLIALAGAAYVQHVSPELPAAYTWLQPYRILRRIAESEGFPFVVALAYLLGAVARLRLSGLRELFFTLLTAWRARGTMAHDSAGGDVDPALRQRRLIRVLAFVLVFALDVALFENHGLLDALALGCFAGYLARPWPRTAVLRLLLHTGCAVLVFTAVCYWFTVIKALTFVGRSQHDADILAFERALTGIYPHRWLAAWASERPTLVYWFDWAYFKIFDHMTLTTAFLMGLRNVRQRTEYLGALAICYFLGGPLYLIFPAAGPAYFDPAQFRFLHQQELIVNYVQAGLFENTAAVNTGHSVILDTWSYIACLPSLHMAHESVMLYYARASKFAFAISFAFSAFTAVAVVVLGWHYPTDILAGFALAALALTVARWQSARLLPAWVVAAEANSDLASTPNAA